MYELLCQLLVTTGFNRTWGVVDVAENSGNEALQEMPNQFLESFLI